MIENLQRWLAIVETISDKRAATLVAEMRDSLELLRTGMSKLIYLATPYTAKADDGTPLSGEVAYEIQAERYYEAAHIAARLIRKGHLVFSPICATHQIALAGKFGGDWKTWQALDERMISLCDELWVATEMDGWRESTGIAAEIQFAQSIGKKVVFYGSET